MKYEYDLIVIGGGAAGLVSSKVAASLGKKVALIEQDRLGGDCTLHGCVPTKTLIAIANNIAHAKRTTNYGCTFDSHNLDSTTILAHVRKVVEEIYAGHTTEKIEQHGITVLYGSASFCDPHTLSVNGKTITAAKFIIATGSEPFIPPIQGIDTVPYLTNKNFFALKELPSSLTILGGGPIGVEFAGCLQRLGTQVTLIERNPSLLPREDHEIQPLVAESLHKEGITLKLGTTATHVKAEHNMITLTCRDAQGSTFEVQSAQLLIATGRKPVIEQLTLANAGIKSTGRGISVNDYMQTTAPHIYAAGDVVGPYLFSHMAEYQASIAARNACIPILRKKVDYSQAVWVTFTDPELATTGLTEKQARQRFNDELTIYRSYYGAYDRPRTDGATTGLAKIICTKNGMVLGAHIYGARAGDIINELQVNSYYKRPLRALYPVIHPYPTYSDVIWQASKKAYVHHLTHNPFLRFLGKLFGVKERS